MTVVNLNLAKQHMKIDGTAEDELVLLYLDGAETWISNYIGRSLTELDPLPADVKIAILRLVSFYYECRNLATFGVSAQLAPMGVTSILDSYREKWFGDGE
ncbi:putative phage protein (predicted DNA packaging) [Peteryoungia aggregata LMG 23059]|uniref:Phage protein (Predicted DNA packaging) n=1 Tax=Peteryoungia aggregata LMG 23059 TaxID=1368425 RepID=A0ABU0G704_9HYPH|nr:head-tail connector protein [Peteryoungia aggregata]MDQ0421110.1 putative phage protein (predicted DNA packaging) [Peteryoungia aggregata LMG 23059]